MRVFRAIGIYVKKFAGEIFVPLEIGKVSPEFPLFSILGQTKTRDLISDKSMK